MTHTVRRSMMTNMVSCGSTIWPSATGRSTTTPSSGEATDTEISEALQSEMAQMACDGELAGLLPRYALLIAVHLSPKPAIEVFHDLFNLLAQYEIRDREQLRTVCEVALG